MSDAASIVVMAAIFVFGVVALTLLVVTIVPATMILESKVCDLRRKRGEAKTTRPSPPDVAA
jgi:hypothetical protein